MYIVVPLWQFPTTDIPSEMKQLSECATTIQL